jgi:murein peptide amidase A
MPVSSGVVAPLTRFALATALVLVLAAPAADAIPRRDESARVLYARSLAGRSIEAYETGDGGGRRILVFGSIHGDETAGIPIAQRLIAAAVTPGTDIWVVPDLNPDGTALHRRQNRDGIDLNRNFPYRWQPIGDGGPFDYPGPRPLSEPESQFALRLIHRLRPAITIWFHQSLRVVDLSGGSAAVERRFGRLVGLPVRRLQRYPGSAPTWQNHRFPGTTSFVVELPAGRLGAGAMDRYGRAVVTLSHDPADTAGAREGERVAARSERRPVSFLEIRDSR